MYHASTAKISGKIITLGTKFNWSPEAVEKETRSMDPAFLKEKVPPFTAVLQHKHGNKWEELVRKTAMMMKDIGANNYLKENRLSQLDNEVLLNVGELDRMVTAEETKAVKDALSHARINVLPGIKHQIDTADPLQMANLICDFIASK